MKDSKFLEVMDKVEELKDACRAANFMDENFTASLITTMAEHFNLSHDEVLNFLVSQVQSNLEVAEIKAKFAESEDKAS